MNDDKKLDRLYKTALDHAQYEVGELTEREKRIIYTCTRWVSLELMVNIKESVINNIEEFHKDLVYNRLYEGTEAFPKKKVECECPIWWFSKDKRKELRQMEPIPGVFAHHPSCPKQS